MFKSYKLASNSKKPYNHNEYMIIDTDFDFIIEVLVMAENSTGIFDYIVLNEYFKRNLDVVKNAALLALFTMETEEISMNTAKDWQEPKCVENIPNWDKIRADRDRYIEKILLLK